MNWFTVSREPLEPILDEQLFGEEIVGEDVQLLLRSALACEWEI